MKILLLIRPVPNSKESSQKPKPSWPFEPKPQLNTSFLELRAIVCASPQDHIKNFDAKCNDFIIPTRLEYFLGMKVEKISCGEGHCVAIIKDQLSNGKLIWSWGNNRYGQLGLGDKSNISLPKPITFLFEYTKNKFESVSCGGFHSLCLINHKENLNWIENDFTNNICKIINDIWNF